MNDNLYGCTRHLGHASLTELIRPGFLEMADNTKYNAGPGSESSQITDPATMIAALPFQTKYFTLQNFYQGTVAKWCFPFSPDKNNNQHVLHKGRVAGTYEDIDICEIHKTKNDTIYNSTILVGENFIYLTGLNVINRVNDVILDCITFDFAEKRTLIVIIQQDGTLLLVVPQIYGYKMERFSYLEGHSIEDPKKNARGFTDYDEENKIMFNFPLLSSAQNDYSLGILATMKFQSKNWKLFKNPQNNRDFILADFESGVIKFIILNGELDFDCKDTLQLDNCEINTCHFLPDINNKLFVSGISANRMVYFLIEWTDDSGKKVHRINHFDTDVVKSSISIGPHNILLCRMNKSVLISTRQIFCGDTNYIEHENNILRGVKSSFFDPNLNQKLINIINTQKLSPIPLESNIDCSIVLTSTCVLYALFVTGNPRDLYAFSLGRFKELRSVYSDPFQEDAKDNSHMLVGLILNRTVRLELDLNKIEFVPLTNKQLPKRHPIENKCTISSNSDDNNNQIVYVSPDNDIWLTGSSSVTHLSPSSIIPIRKTKMVGKFHKDLKKYDRINLAETDSKGQLGIEGVICGQPSVEFIFDEDVQHYEKIPNTDSVPTILQKSFASHSVAVYKHRVVCYTNETEKELLSTDLTVDGATTLLNKIILWNVSKKAIWYVENIDRNDTVTCHKYYGLSGFIKEGEDFSLYLYSKVGTCDDLEVVIVTQTKIVSNFWDPKRNTGSRSASKAVGYGRDAVIMICKPYQFNILSNGLFCFLSLDGVSPKIIYGDDLRQKRFSIIDKKLLGIKLDKVDILIKALTNSIVIIYPDRLYRILRDNKHGPSLYAYDDSSRNKKIRNHAINIEEIKLPIIENHKELYLMDVESFHQEGRELLCLLYDGGMQWVETTYITWNKTDNLLQNIRSRKKQFTYLKGFKRMLVTNGDTGDCYLLNPQNGKVKMLHHDCLKVTGEHIQNVLELPFVNSEEKSSPVLFIFQTVIKYIRLSAVHCDVEVKEISQHVFKGDLYKEYSLYEDSVTLLERFTDKETFHKLLVDPIDGSIKFCHNFSIKAKLSTNHFAVGKNYIILSSGSLEQNMCVMLYDIYNISGDLTMDYLVDHVSIPHEITGYPRKLLNAFDGVIIAITDQDKSTFGGSKITFEAMLDGVARGGRHLLIGSYDDPDEVCFWAYMSKNTYQFNGFHGDNRSNENFFGFLASIHLPHLDAGAQYVFPSFNIDKQVLDAWFEDYTLTIMCADQSVLQFACDEQLFDVRSGAVALLPSDIKYSEVHKNYGYIPSDDRYLKKKYKYKVYDENSCWSRYIDPWGRRVIPY